MNPQEAASEPEQPESPIDPIEESVSESEPGNEKIVGGGLPAIATPPDPGDYKSPVILPSSGAREVLPGTAFSEKLKLDDKTLAQLGVTSADDLGDDIELERSPLDGACVVVSMKDGMAVCQYCFRPFAVGIPEYEPAEIQVAKPSGMEQGLRVKVHASCHVRHMKRM
jgi:hypothetical protein